MITNRLSELIEIAGKAIVNDRPDMPKMNVGGVDELSSVLSQKNGFYAFESALHVLPSHGSGIMTLSSWNSGKLWRGEYGDLTEGLFFFAEDVFGGQFSLEKSGIFYFDPETGGRRRIAPDLEGWADCILTDFNYLTGYPLAYEWQKKNGILKSNYRLIPKIPFICGGQYTLDNLAMMDAVKGMRWRADLARQIKDLPDGSQIKLKAIMP